jgi:hypothetical protein
MNIQDVPVVKSVGEEGYKFIVVCVVKPETKEEKLVVRAHQDCEYHRDILAWFKNEELQGSSLKCGCVGGGRIRINTSDKTVEIWDSSGDFGEEPDRTLTVTMLQEAFPEFVVSESKGW